MIGCLSAHGWLRSVDEIERRPLVGAVITAAVILDPSAPSTGLNDSKKAGRKRRLALMKIKKALNWSLEPRGTPRIVVNILRDHAGDAARRREIIYCTGDMY